MPQGNASHRVLNRIKPASRRAPFGGPMLAGSSGELNLSADLSQGTRAA